LRQSPCSRTILVIIGFLALLTHVWDIQRRADNPWPLDVNQAKAATDAWPMQPPARVTGFVLIPLASIGNAGDGCALGIDKHAESITVTPQLCGYPIIRGQRRSPSPAAATPGYCIVLRQVQHATRSDSCWPHSRQRSLFQSLAHWPAVCSSWVLFPCPSNPYMRSLLSPRKASCSTSGLTMDP